MKSPISYKIVTSILVAIIILMTAFMAVTLPPTGSARARPKAGAEGLLRLLRAAMMTTMMTTTTRELTPARKPSPSYTTSTTRQILVLLCRK